MTYLDIFIHTLNFKTKTKLGQKKFQIFLEVFKKLFVTSVKWLRSLTALCFKRRKEFHEQDLNQTAVVACGIYFKIIFT